MEVDVNAEIDRLSDEIRQLGQQMKDLDQQKQSLANEIVKRQGAIELLETLDKTQKAG